MKPMARRPRLADDEDLEPFATRLLMAAEELGVFPAVALKVREVAEDPHSSLGQLEAVVHLDPVLAARLLALARSPVYGHTEVRDLAQALRVLGFFTTAQLSLGLALSDKTQDTPGALERWCHALDVAAACQVLARFSPGRRQDEGFVLGLLHDVGRELLVLVEGQVYAPLATCHDEASLVVREQWHIGTDHSVVGGQCLTAWGLPDPLVYAVARHHACTDDQHPPDTRELALLVLAEALLDPTEDADSLALHPANHQLGLSPQILDHIRQESAQLAQQLRRAL